MTNILLLPQLQATFNIANNADWTDQIKFLQEDGETPLDLTGIVFHGQMRPSTDSPVVSLDIGTDAYTIVNGGTDGMLTWNVPASLLKGIPTDSYVFDLLAIADNHIINMFQKAGPASVFVNEGITKEDENPDENE